MILTDRLFQQFSEIVYRECGINLHSGKKSLLQARLNKRLRATGIQTYGDYYGFLVSKQDSQEIVHFLDCISTNLTYFFREPQHFDFLNQVIPDLIEQKIREKSNRIRIWSAGCSTGEEPYSLAMCIMEHLGISKRMDVKILATDISTRVLSIAMQGVYGNDKLKSIASGLKSKYLRNTNGNHHQYEIASELKNIITFSRLNLKEQYPFKGPFDIIFCRNVMIYFDKETQENLVNKMARYLAVGGYLFVGHSESLMGLNHELSYVKPAIYRK
jgi:chemotaxis protein methyltransferase CheR